MQGAAWVGAGLPVLSGKASARTYRELLDTTLTAMESGNHASAIVPLKEALLIDRTEPCGLLALGTLYLHTGSSRRATHEFARVRKTFPNDILAEWGQRMASLLAGEKVSFTDLLTITVPEKTSRETIPEETILLLQEYQMLMTGKARAVKNATSYVTASEKNLLRLEIAAFAAIKDNDTVRGEELLCALLEQPDMRPLSEDSAVLLSFLPEAPVQAGAPVLPTAISLPEPTIEKPLSGVISLSPPHPLPTNIAFVTYEVKGGGGYTASVNYPPYVAEWNSTRFPNGLYVIRTTIYDANGNILRIAEKAVMTTNAEAPLSRSLQDGERQAFRARLLHLLTPRPTRKAAHFTLATLASKRGDEEEALSHIEAVVAIDPLYNNARESLKQYNRAVIGHCPCIWRGITTEKLVALTFDDGPHPLNTAPLLDALKAAEAAATFFVVGIRAEASPELLQRMHKEGHELANHSYSHPNLTFLSRSGIERELCRTSCIIRGATGKRPRFYRPPGGNANRAVTEVAEMLGMSGAFWTVDGLQYERPPCTTKQLTEYVFNKVRPGAIILLHNAPANTVAAIPDIVRGLRERGYSLVTMSELVKRSKPDSTINMTPLPPEMHEIK